MQLLYYAMCVTITYLFLVVKWEKATQEAAFICHSFLTEDEGQIFDENVEIMKVIWDHLTTIECKTT